MSLATFRPPQRRLKQMMSENKSMQENEIYFDSSLERLQETSTETKPTHIRKRSKASSITSLDEMLTETKEMAFGPSDPHKIKQSQYPMILRTTPSKSSGARIGTMTSLRVRTEASLSSKSTSDRDQGIESSENLVTDILFLPRREKAKQEPEAKPIRSLEDLRSGFGQFFVKCEDLSQRLKRVEKRTDETEKAYMQSMQDINVKIGDPLYKFDFWKENETYLQKKNKLKNEITRFKNKAIEMERTQAFLEGVANYLPKKNIAWDEEEYNKQDDLDFVQKMILKEPQAFRIKKKPTKRIQISQRKDHIDMLLKTDQSDDIFADFREIEEPAKMFTGNEVTLEPDVDMTKITKDSGKEKRRSSKSSKSHSMSECYDSLSLEIPKQSVEPLHTFEITEEDSACSSAYQVPQPTIYDKSRCNQKLRSVRYFVGKSGRETVRRVCKPTPIEEEKLRVFEFKNDFNAFKRSTSSQRAQKTVRFNL